MIRLERIQKDSPKFLSRHIRILKKLFFEIKNLNLEDTERSNHPHWFDKITITNFLLLNFLGLDFLRDSDENQLKDWQEVYIKHSNPIKLVIHIMKHNPAIPFSQKMIDYYHKNEETLSRNLGKINWIYYSQLLNSGYIWIRNYHTSDSFPPNSITFDIFDKLSFLPDEENATKETTQQGVVYTPYNIASQIVKRSIDRIIEKRDFSLEFQNNLSKIRILDPSVGTGVFLIAAGNIITEELSKNCKKENLTKLRKNIVTNNLFGLDIDPLGINITKIKLFLWISERDSNIDQEIIGFKNIRVGDTLFGFSPTSKLPYDSNKSDLTENFEDIFLKHLGVFQIHRKKTLHEKIQHINKIKNDIVKLEGFRYFILEGRQEEWNLHNSGLNPAIRKRVHFSKTDSYRNTENYYAIFKQDTLELRQNLPSYIKPYHFKSAFHWVDMQFSIKFDLIIGNPPFIALTDLSMLSRLKLNNFYPEIYNGNSDLASFFIYRMREFISNNGILGFILPKYVMTSVHSTKIREAILNDFGILEIHDFDKSTIFRAYSVKTVFFLLRRKKTERNHLFEFFKYNEGLKNSTEKQILPQSNLIDRKWIILSSHHQEIIDHLNKQSEYRLEDIAVLSKGIETGCDQVFAPSEPYYFSKKLALDSLYIRPWLKGKEIKQFRIIREGREVLYAPKSQEERIRGNKVIFNYLKQRRSKLLDRSRVFKYYLWRVGDERYTINWKDSKLVTPYKAKENTFAIDIEGCLSSKDVVWVIPQGIFQRSEILYFLTGILNSKILNFFTRYWLKDLGGVFDYYPQQIKDIPIIIPPLASVEFEKVVKISIYLQNQPPESKNENIIEELNNTVYKIFNLTKEQISYIESDLAEQPENN